MNLTPEQTTLIGTLAGTIIGVLSGFISSLVTIRSQERRDRRELIIKAAVESWKQSVDTVISARRGKIYGFDVYIIHMLKMAELLDKKKLTPSEVLELMKQADEVTRTIIQYKDSQSESKVS